MNNTENKKIYKVAIIGGGAGGLFASTTADFFDFDNIIIEQKPYLGGQPLELYPNKYIYDFPCFKAIKSNDVIKMLIEQQEATEKSTVLLNTKVIDVKETKFDEEPGFEIVVESNSQQSRIYCENIIIATGNGSFNPRKLEIDNVEINHELIHYSVDITSSTYQNKKVIVLGGGDSAVDWSNYFVDEKITNDVTIVHRRNAYRCSSVMVQNLTKNNIKQKLNYDVIGINFVDQKLKIQNKETMQIEELEYDYIIVQYGQQSSPFNIPLFEKINKEKNKFLIDLSQKTNVPYIYAIGDCTIFQYKANTIVTTCAEATRAIWHISKNKSREW